MILKKKHDAKLKSAKPKKPAVKRNISARKQAEEQLSISEERFRSLFKAVPVPVFTWQKDGDDFVLIDHNDSAAPFTHGAITGHIGIKAKDMYRDDPQILKDFDRCFQSRSTVDRETDYQFKFSEEKKYLHVKYAFVPPDLVMVHTEDFTERRQMEEALQKSEKRYRRLLDSVTDYIYSVQIKDGRPVSTVHGLGCAGVTGYTPADYEADPNLWYRMVYEPDRPIVMEQAARALAGESAPPIEHRIFHQNGSIRWVKNTCVPRYDQQMRLAAYDGLILDITERKQAEEALRESEEKFKYVFDNSTDGKSITLPTGEINTNKALADMFGYTREELQNKKWHEITHPDDLDLTQKAVVQLLSGEQDSVRFSKRYIHKNGSVVWVDVSTAIRRDKDGKALYFMTSIVDVTERKRAEDAQKENERVKSELLERLNEAQHIAMIGSWEWNLQTDQVWWSDETYRIFGVTQKEFVPSFEANGKFIHPEDFTSYGKVFEHSLKTGEPLDYEFRLVANDGVLKCCRSMGKIIYDDSGQQTRFIGTVMDVTERKQAEEALQAASSYNRRLIEASIDPLVTIGPDGKITDVNKATETVTGVLREQLIGDDFSNYFTEPEKAKEGYQKVLAEGFVRDYPLTIRQPSGKTTDVLYNAIVYKNKAGEIEGIFAAAHDITESKRAEQALYEQQQVFRTLVENSPDIIARYDRECHRIYVNPAYVKTAQIPQQELLTTSPIQVSPLPTTSAEILQNLIRKVLDSGVAEAVDVIWPKADNIDYWYNIYASPEFDREGQVVSVMTVSRDITERKQAEEALRESETRARAMLRAIPDLMFRMNRQGIFIDYKADIHDLYFQSNSTIIDRHNRDITPPEFASLIDLKISAALETGELQTFEYQLSIPNKGARDYEARMIASGAEEVIAIVRDITERKLAEDQREAALEKLRESEERYRIISENVADVIWVLDPAAGRFTYVSPSVEKLRGYTPDEVLTQPVNESLTPESLKRVEEMFAIRIPQFLSRNSEKMSFLDEVDQPCRDGSIVNTEVRTTYLRNERGELEVIGITRDITERKKVEERLTRFSRIFEDSLNEIYIFDAEDLRFIQVNHGAQINIGYSMDELRKMTPLDIKPEYSLEKFLELVTPLRRGTEKKVVFETKHRRKNGSLYPVEVHLQLSKYQSGDVFVAIILDITERKQAEEEIRELNATLEQRVEERTQELHDAQEQLVRKEKLAVLGQMAGSVGHELRNPLGVISNAVYFLKMSQPDADEKVKEYLSLIEKQIHISDKIVTDLLDFTRIKSAQLELVSVSELIYQTLERFPAPESVQVIVDQPAEELRGYFDPQHVIQILGNLILNAFQSMPNGGRLTITTRAQDEIIRIAVQDTGVGITPENMKKLFEPLFTTKPKGIGLGLVVSQKLAETSGGRIEVESEPGKGSAFTVYLPSKQGNSL